MMNFVKENMPLLVVSGQIFSVLMLIIFLYRSKFPKAYTLIEKHSLLIAFLFSSFALCGSLFYSDILGYEPCKFCWIQRIFMYPLTLMFFIAMLKKDYKIFQYAVPMAILGGLLAINHYILQTTGVSILPCQAVGYSISCSKVFVMSYGYITIPLMAFTAFFGVIISMLYVRRIAKNNASSQQNG